MVDAENNTKCLHLPVEFGCTKKHKKPFTLKLFLFINLHYQAEENLDITTKFII